MTELPDTARFVSRDACILCGSTELVELDGGRFNDDPLRAFIAADPWGEDPLASIGEDRWSLVRCARCAMKFHRRILSPHWNEVRFSRWMDEASIRAFEAEHGGGPAAREHVQHILRLEALGVRRLLDFGCGFGAFLEMCRLWGLDAVGVDRSHARRAGAGIEIVAELDELDGLFDAVTLFEVLEHLDDPRATLRELRAHLRPGGVLVVEVPDTQGADAIRARESYAKLHPLDHINAFTPETLVRMVETEGFRAIAKRPAFVTTSPQRLAKDIAKAAVKQAGTQRYFRRVA